ncbi:MAG: DUF434 domain-containing protein [Candidatus Heimdallarchaeota archaeon]|nr:DUF434 domain-containing protein [Candidatus Heimdallarchaeota archaeon]
MTSSFNFSKNQAVMFRAYSEINWLLDKGYSKKSSINFVGNHYKLPKKVRYILNRATQAIEVVENIASKKITDSNQLNGLIFNIDLYNQFTSYQSLLDNDPLIICRDGFYRDIFSVLHSKKQLRFDFNSLSSYITGLLILKPSFLYLYIDQQRSNSRKHSLIVKKILSKNLIPGECIVSKSVDYVLKIQTEGVIFSHDSIVLGKSIASFDYFHWFIKIRNLRNRLPALLINFSENKNRN